MKVFFITTAVILFIMLMPFPIVFEIKYENKKLLLIVNKINFTRRFLSKRYIKKEIKKAEQIDEKIKHTKFRETYEKLLNKIMPLIHYYFHSFGKSRFKPKINFKLDFIFGLGDAAQTAILYGLLCSANPLLYVILRKLTLIKNYSFDINPDLNNKIFQFKLNSIIWVNLAQIIYITIILIKGVLLYGRSSNRKSNEKHT